MTRKAMHKPATDHWTYEDYLKLPDDGTRCEIIEGERLMTPAPSFRHQNALASDVTGGEARSPVVLPGFAAPLADIFRA